MTLRNKLSLASSALFALIMGIVMLGTFLLFKKNTNNVYFKKLLERCYTSAFFYFEKDELTSQKYQKIVDAFQRIHSEHVSIYTYPEKQIFVHDSESVVLDNTTLDNIFQKKRQTFFVDESQYAAIFYNDNQGDFIVVVSGTDVVGQRQIDTLGNMMLIFFVSGVALHFFLSSFLAKRTFKPFSSLINRVNKITANNLNSRLPIHAGPKGEIQELTATFNNLLQRLEDGVLMQKNFLKNASHELKTPLTVIIGDSDVALSQSRTVEEYETALRSVRNNALHFKSILESLLLLSGLELSEQQNIVTVRVDEVLWDVLEKKKIEYPKSSVQFNLDAVIDSEELLIIHGNRDLLFIALSNIVDNAIKFSSPEPITITAFHVDRQLRLAIIDKGPGISKKDQSLVFNAFYRSGATREINGQGLGLFITKKILDMHKIQMDIESGVAKGATILLGFPEC